MFETLMSKTFIILAGSLFFSWLGSLLSVQWHQSGSASMKNYFCVSIISLIAIGLLLFFANSFPLNVCLVIVFTGSVGFGLGVYFVAYEGIAQKALSLTVLTTLMTGLVAMYSGLDFTWLGQILFISLSILVLLSIIRIFINIGGRRFTAGFSVFIFTGYLLFDFNRLAKAQEIAVANNWETALNLAINIYLDVINLFVYLVEYMASSGN